MRIDAIRMSLENLRNYDKSKKFDALERKITSPSSTSNMSHVPGRRHSQPTRDQRHCSTRAHNRNGSLQPGNYGNI